MNRERFISHFAQAEREASEVCLMLRMALADLRENPDDQQVANVVAVAQTRSTRLTVQLLRTLSGIP